MELIPGVHGQFNIWKSFGVTHHTNKLNKKNYVIVLSDT